MPIPGAPGGLYSAVYYVVAFGGGVIAKRGKWLEGLESAFSVTQARLCHTLSFLLPCMMFYYLGDPIYYGNSSPSKRTAAVLFKGVMPMTIIISQLLLFHKYLNWSNRFTKFLAEAAYAVYLLHSHIVSWRKLNCAVMVRRYTSSCTLELQGACALVSACSKCKHQASD